MRKYLLSTNLHVLLLVLLSVGFAWRGSHDTAQRTQTEALAFPSTAQQIHRTPFINRESSPYWTQSITFQTDQSPTEILRFYHGFFIQQGWQVLDPRVVRDQFWYESPTILAAYATTVVVWPFASTEYLITIDCAPPRTDHQTVELMLYRR